MKLYTDGSYTNIEPNVVGFASIIVKDDNDTDLEAIYGYSTSKMDVESRNVGGEIAAVITGVKALVDRGIHDIEIYYDYLGIEMWATSKWKTNKALTMGYKSFIEEMTNNGVNITFHKVKSHSGHMLNDVADTYAKKGIFFYQEVENPLEMEMKNEMIVKK